MILMAHVKEGFKNGLTDPKKGGAGGEKETITRKYDILLIIQT